MSLISLLETAKDFGTRKLFSNLTLHINRKEKLGLIGPNGSGKSTLLKILAGEESVDQGTRKCQAKLRIKHVKQSTSFNSERTVLEEVWEGCKEKKELLLRFKKLSHQISLNPDEALLKELG